MKPLANETVSFRVEKNDLLSEVVTVNSDVVAVAENDFDAQVDD